ncbi:MAG: transporter substrate-binding domain-containing protein [Pseudomonadota bacterium]
MEKTLRGTFRLTCGISLAAMIAAAPVQHSSADENTIRVGTTGDYRPVTWYDPSTDQYSGTEITLVEAFAGDRGLTIEFVRTTWPTLMEDLLANDFDMAVGGISWTQQRADQALTSVTIETFGKVAVVRCGEEDRFGSLEAIDQPGIRIVENRGGTNEQFALSQIRHATLTIVPNNSEPPEYLMENRADVFFTDSIEAVYFESLEHGLCAVNADHPYTHGTKVFLFAEGEVTLRDDFDAWFTQRSSDED